MLNTFRSYQLAVQFYKITHGLKLPYHLKEQLGRASSSVALNLAEGSAKTGRKDRLRFEIALGSVRECEAIMDLAEAPARVHLTLDAVARNVYTLCKSLRT